MLQAFYARLGETSPVAVTIFGVAVMLMGGYGMTRITKLLRLPNVTAYIVAGILLGPFVLDAVPGSVVDGMGFVPDIALAFIAFSTGEFFRFSVLRRGFGRVTVVTLFEALAASAVVFVLTYFILGLELPFSLILSALASTTAPASTVMTIRQTGAQGDFVETLLQVVALDDVVGLVAYSVAVSVAVAMQSGSFSPMGVIRPVAVNLLSLLLGCVFGGLLRLLMPKRRSTDNRLIISVALLFAFCGLCAVLDVSPLLGCMAMGTVYINLTGDEKLFKQLNYFSPPILLLFFVRSGLTFRLDVLTDTGTTLGSVPLLVVGVLYFVVRIAGKYGGAALGARVAGKSAAVRRYLGLALIPQAGVAIGLAALGARTLGGTWGEALQAVVLASSVLYELIGPACAKAALHLSHSFDAVSTPSQAAAAEEAARVRLAELTEKIQEIQKELPPPSRDVNPEEEAFEEAAEEWAGAMGRGRRL